MGTCTMTPVISVPTGDRFEDVRIIANVQDGALQSGGGSSPAGAGAPAAGAVASPAVTPCQRPAWTR